MVTTTEYLPERTLKTASDVPTLQTRTVEPGKLDQELASAAVGTKLKLKDGETYETRGDHPPRDDCTIVGPVDEKGYPTATIKYTGTGGSYLLRGGIDDDYAIENVVIDYGDDWEGSMGILLRVGGHALLRNVHFKGNNPTRGNGAVDNVAVMATSEDGTVVVRDCVRDGPTEITSHGHLGNDSNDGWLWMGDKHKGNLYVCDTRIENTGTNAVYASRTNGSIHLFRCEFDNNNQASIRIGGGQGKSTIRECDFTIDTANAHPDNRGPFINPHAIICETDSRKDGVRAVPVEVSDTDFYLKTAPENKSRLIFVDGSAGPVSFERCRIRSERADCAAFHALSDARWGGDAADQSITFTDTHISGAGTVRVDGGRTAVADGGCLSAPTSGVATNGVETGECDRPVASLVTVDDDPVETTRLRVTGTGTKTNYRIVTTGEVRPLADVERWDSVRNGRIEAWITKAGDTDTYELTGGEVQSVEFLEGYATIEIGDETLGMTDDTPVGSCIGGGADYEHVVHPDEADVLVSTKDELNNALLNASAGDVVYIDGDASIAMRESRFTVPRGVTLASDRGIDGSNGALLKSNDHPWAMLEVQDNVRITGLRLGGPRWEWEDETETTEMAIDAAGRRGVEVDNVEGYGWGYAVVRTGDDTHVHHCHLHHCSRMGHGYGVATEGSEYPIIEYNHFAHNRHSVQGNGGGYEIRYNLVDPPAISHVFDQHKPGGTTMRIHHNTVRVVDDAGGRKDLGNAPAVVIRGVPTDIAEIHHNWFFNPKTPRGTPDGWTDEAVVQVGVSAWKNVHSHDNHFGSDDPGPDYGCPREAVHDDEAADEGTDEVTDGDGDEPSLDRLSRLSFDFPEGGKYTFQVTGRITDYPASADVHEAKDGTGEVAIGYAYKNWSPEFMVSGDIVEERFYLPDSAVMSQKPDPN